MLDMFFSSVATYMTDRLLPVVIGTALFLALRWLLIFRGKLRRCSVAHEIGIGLFALYGAMILALTFLPVFSGFGYYQFRSSLLRILLGYYEAGHWGSSMFLGNALMFIPLGFLLPLLWKWFRWYRTLPVCLAVILCIELLQPITGHSFDIDDVVLNFLGSVIGLALSALPRRLLPGLVSNLQCRAG